jgi:hypothetical protein
MKSQASSSSSARGAEGQNIVSFKDTSDPYYTAVSSRSHSPSSLKRSIGPAYSLISESSQDINSHRFQDPVLERIHQFTKTFNALKLDEEVVSSLVDTALPRDSFALLQMIHILKQLSELYEKLENERSALGFRGRLSSLIESKIEQLSREIQTEMFFYEHLLSGTMYFHLSCISYIWSL